MKRVICLLVVASILSLAGISEGSIQFSPCGDGGWTYSGISSSSGTFSFVQDIIIDSVNSQVVDALCGMSIVISDLSLQGYSYELNPYFGILGHGMIASGATIQIVGALGTVVLEGTIAEDSYVDIGDTALMFPLEDTDIQVTYVASSISAYLDGISAGDYFDLNLTLNSPDLSFNQMIKNVMNTTETKTLSGTMTWMIPEPATIILLGIGGVLFTRKR